MQPSTYFPNVFAVNDIPSAMRIILTPEGSTTEERWRTETPHVAELIGRSMNLTPNSIVLDYGCGIGRMAKELIARFGCYVLGVDISPNMRALSVLYAQTDRFLACAPEMLDGLTEQGFRCDGAISIWVLQHCLRPADDIARIHKAMKPDGGLFVLNNDHRAVPTVERGWINDGISIKSMLTSKFALQEEGRLPRGVVADSLADVTFWANFRRS